jgi:uncharacterized protein (DUF924 family)
MSGIDEVLQYWLEPKPRTAEEAQACGRRWFAGGADQDREIREKFGELVEQARAGRLDDWARTTRGRLALIVLLDQFSRNLYRNQPEAFAKDSVALELARGGLESGDFGDLDSVELLFAYLPFSHAEDLGLQRVAVAYAQKAALRAPPEWREMMMGAVDFARKHLDVIARFGRFPHRNATLGRSTTEEEQEYLDYLRSIGQWL